MEFLPCLYRAWRGACTPPMAWSIIPAARHRVWRRITGRRWRNAAASSRTSTSSSGAVLEAAARLTDAGRSIRVVVLRLLAPLRREALLEALNGADQVLVVEQNHGAQLFRYLRSEQALPPQAISLARPGPLPLRPREIIDALPTES